MTDAVTISRETLQAAIDALECALSDSRPYIVKSREVSTTLRAALAAQPAEPVAWQPMDTAPKDGTSVRLLIADGEHPLSDDNPSVSIGSFGIAGGPDEDPTWTFAGWCWHQDCYTKGTGTPIGWLPAGDVHGARSMPSAAPPPTAVPPGYVLVPVNELAYLRERAGFNNGWSVWPPCSVDQVAVAVAREQEREACAALCDDHASIEGIAQRCAAAIRAR